MVAKSFADILEQLSLLLIEQDFTQSDARSQLVTMLGELQISMPDMTDHQALGALVQARALADAIKSESSTDPDHDLQVIGEKIGFLQTRAGGALSSSPQSQSATGFALPEWVDAAIFDEFVAAQKINLEELETEIFALERGEDDALAAIKRRVHTLKGESGVLGLDDMSHVCHGIEDYVADESDPQLQVEALFKVKDWIESALKAYVDQQFPDPRAEELIKNFASSESAPKKAGSSKASAPKKVAKKTKKKPPKKAKAAQSSASKTGKASSKKSSQKTSQADDKVQATPQTAKPETAAPATTVDQHVRPEPADIALELQPVQRDEETVALIAEFLTEGQDGLSQADEILIAGEQNGIDPDQINAMFRVFHTIKGVSSFLDFEQVTSLAHKTETLLNLAREGSLELAGAALDAVFDATAMLRELSEKIFEAVEAGTSVQQVAGHAELIARLEAVINGEAAAAPPPPKPAAEKTAPKAKTEQSDPPDAPLARDAATDQTQRQLPAAAPANAPTPDPVPPTPVHAAPAPGKSKAKRSATKIRETVKVDLERVESLVEMIGELVIVESMVVHSPEIQSSASVVVRNYLGQLTKITRDLQDIGMRMRMVPVRGVFQKMARMVRDLARKKDKDIKFILSGEGTEMDRSLVEQIADPLVHMIRNAVDHGVEDADVRIAAGKDPVGHIELSAFHQGGNIVIKISDDGGGLDKDAIMKKALEKGIVSPGEKLSDNEIHNLIFAPGFSTAKVVSEISGRGVGMDVVRRNIKAMRGRVSIKSTPGGGSEFLLMLPLTTAIIDGMLIRCASENFIIPTLSIVEAVQPSADMLHSMAERGELMTLRGETLPMLRLDKLLGIDGAKQDATEALVVVVESIGQRVGILVDDVVTQQQVVIKSLTGEVKDIKYISGAAILSDGRVGLILNVDEMGALAAQGQSDAQAAKVAKEIKAERMANASTEREVLQ